MECPTNDNCAIFKRPFDILTPKRPKLFSNKSNTKNGTYIREKQNIEITEPIEKSKVHGKRKRKRKNICAKIIPEKMPKIILGTSNTVEMSEEELQKECRRILEKEKSFVIPDVIEPILSIDKVDAAQLTASIDEIVAKNEEATLSFVDHHIDLFESPTAEASEVLQQLTVPDINSSDFIRDHHIRVINEEEASLSVKLPNDSSEEITVADDVSSEIVANITDIEGTVNMNDCSLEAENEETSVSSVDLPIVCTENIITEPSEKSQEITELDIEKSDYACDYSPMSPKPEDCSCDENRLIPEIPLMNLLATNNSQVTPIMRIITNYSNKKRQQKLQEFNINEKLKKVYIFMNEIIKEYLNGDITTSNAKICFEKLLVDQNSIQNVSETVVYIIGKRIEEPINQYNMLQLTDTQYKLLFLAFTIGKENKKFRPSLFLALDKEIFTLKIKLFNIDKFIHLTRFYVRLVGLDVRSAPKLYLFIYKCLYYYGFKAIPMITIILEMYPAIMPNLRNVNSDKYNEMDPMALTLVNVLIEFFKINAKKKSNKFTIFFKFLQRHYDYKFDQINTTDLLKIMVNKIQSNKCINVGFSLVLIAKRKGYDWSRINILNKFLFPLLNEYMLIDKNNRELQSYCMQNDVKIALCINTISTILKTHTDAEEIIFLMQLFTNILHESDSKIVQEAVIESLLRLSRVGYEEVYKRICKWQPKFPISRKLELMMESFIHRKDRNFWKKLYNEL